MSGDKHKGAYIYGKFFDTGEEMMDYARKFPDMPIDLDWYKDFLRQRYDEAIMNKSINPHFTNRVALLLLCDQLNATLNLGDNREGAKEEASSE